MGFLGLLGCLVSNDSKRMKNENTESDDTEFEDEMRLPEAGYYRVLTEMQRISTAISNTFYDNDPNFLFHDRIITIIFIIKLLIVIADNRHRAPRNKLSTTTLTTTSITIVRKTSYSMM